LDEDLAARSASLGRIYNDLGFGQLGLVEGWKSVNADPSNYSAHRLLADNYSVLPRHEIARVSELLKSQLLQPINITPVQPQLAESNLLILDGLGPQTSSFNEFNPLFARNRLAIQASGVYGNNNTWGEQVTHSGLWNNFSYSLGQFHYETDGFRKNNDLKQDIYNIFIQAAINSKLSLQAEFRHKETKHGDLELSFNSDDFSRSDNTILRQDTSRIGARYQASQNSNFLLSIIYNDLYGNRDIQSDLFSQKEKSKQRGYQGEIQYIFRNDFFNMSFGYARYDINIGSKSQTDLFPFCILPSGCSSRDDFINRSDGNDKIKQDNGYVYTNFNILKNLALSIGLSYTSFRKKELDIGKFDPKFGLQWDVTKNTRIRFAAFKTLKRALIVNQTIEPTQVAGFNQFFDDLNGTKSTLIGVGVDTKLASNLYSGIQVSFRSLDQPFTEVDTSTQANTNGFEKIKEEIYRAYLNLTLSSAVSISLEPRFERFKKNKSNQNLPKEIETIIVPLNIRYFNSSGFFAKAGVTVVQQDVDQFSESAKKSGNNGFVTADAGIGYRLPKRLGILSVEALNILDKDFKIQDLNFQSSTLISPRFIPERTLLFRATLNF
jgi:hypothetical protein